MLITRGRDGTENGGGGAPFVVLLVILDPIDREVEVDTDDGSWIREALSSIVLLSGCCDKPPSSSSFEIEIDGTFLR
jgi:hypothetical protein